MLAKSLITGRTSQYKTPVPNATEDGRLRYDPHFRATHINRCCSIINMTDTTYLINTHYQQQQQNRKDKISQNGSLIFFPQQISKYYKLLAISIIKERKWIGVRGKVSKSFIFNRPNIAGRHVVFYFYCTVSQVLG